MEPTLKKEIIMNFALSTNLEELKDSSIVLLTAAGTIIGKVANIKTDENGELTEVIPALINTVVKNFKEKSSIEGSLPGNDGYILLQNAKVLHNNGSTTNIAHLTVFFDHIIGVTIGSID
ncbi:hypothetical protein [Paratissierella segnis]|uniref:Uncharacterized protein n=1 Tax=Paratissierella segnis TaxID=2763679 RepID=A0A926EZR6_9FIRM|nr:hypothetical protein [Paratissierella segnis]MBC8589369.1 hypothetical protein [Paratissierella segnis]